MCTIFPFDFFVEPRPAVQRCSFFISFNKKLFSLIDERETPVIRGLSPSFLTKKSKIRKNNLLKRERPLRTLHKYALMRIFPLLLLLLLLFDERIR
jgi:hypothetical protein